MVVGGRGDLEHIVAGKAAGVVLHHRVQQELAAVPQLPHFLQQSRVVDQTVIELVKVGLRQQRLCMLRVPLQYILHGLAPGGHQQHLLLPPVLGTDQPVKAGQTGQDHL